MTFSLNHRPPLWIGKPQDTDYLAKLNALITFRLAKKLLTPGKQTHFFHGRYENIYIDAEKITGLNILLAEIMLAASGILKQPAQTLHYGFWFNAMQPGHVTSLHTHDNDDELLSVVYYLTTPDNSGDFIFHHDGEKQSHTPCTGDLLLFAPDLPHEVSENISTELRLSLALNIGPAIPENN